MILNLIGNLSKIKLNFINLSNNLDLILVLKLKMKNNLTIYFQQHK